MTYNIFNPITWLNLIMVNDASFFTSSLITNLVDMFYCDIDLNVKQMWWSWVCWLAGWWFWSKDCQVAGEGLGELLFEKNCLIFLKIIFQSYSFYVSAENTFSKLKANFYLNKLLILSFIPFLCQQHSNCKQNNCRVQLFVNS